ncbi:capsular biosynthesis protein [Pseudooceanicola sp. C21-150M6]|uniref:capsular polysaccharide export protein, LipB/KpsS family n=1 Tax=Pseudooceanicola sp. C21-150M6 TaxID=3434355 RepID=UPI003D7F286F
MAETGYRFICLDPRKRKRSMVATVLDPLGPVRWLSLAPMSLRSFPETRSRAIAAAAAAIRQPRSALGRGLKLQLLKLQYNGARRLFLRNPDAVAVAWNGLNGTRRVFMDGAQDAGVQRLFFELCPFPDRITCDPEGVNAANMLPDTIGPYQTWLSGRGQVPDWRALGRDFRQRAPVVAAPAAASGPESAGALQDAPSLTKPFLFAPLQVAGDSQLRLFGGAFPTVETFVQALGRACAALPAGWHLRIKEHPSSKIAYGDLIRSLAADLPVILDNETDTFDLVRASRAVVTVNSSVGMEAMFFDKPVLACGRAFWAIDGVARQAATEDDLAAAFAQPDSITFDRAARDAFMGYLTEVYYPRLSAFDGPDGATEADKIRARLMRGRPALPGLGPSA